MTINSSLVVFFYLFFVICTARNTPLQVSEYSEERIVTNLDVIQSTIGVSLNFNYNESITSNGQLVSAPGCPESIDGYPWVYSNVHASTPEAETRCFLAGHQGTCPFGQVLLVQTGTAFGVCGCECLLHLEEDESDLENKNGEKYRLCSGIVQQAYDTDDKSVCYQIDDQGPCPAGKALGISSPRLSSDESSSQYVACLPICNRDDDDWDTLWSKGECTEGPRRAAGASLFGIHPSDCRKGERFSGVLKRCVKRQPKKTLFIG